MDAVEVVVRELPSSPWWQWPILNSGVAAVAAMFSGIATYCAWRAAKRANSAVGTDMLMRLWDRYDGPELSRARRDAGEAFWKEGRLDANPLDRIYDFFEVMGAMLGQRNVESQPFWHMYEEDACSYWFALCGCGTRAKPANPSWYANFAWVVGEFQRISRRERGRDRKVDLDNFRRFMAAQAGVRSEVKTFGVPPLHPPFTRSDCEAVRKAVRLACESLDTGMPEDDVMGKMGDVFVHGSFWAEKIEDPFSTPSTRVTIAAVVEERPEPVQVAAGSLREAVEALADSVGEDAARADATGSGGEGK